MKTTLNIKNFRIFDEKGVTFEINPITILTGANSSGKSSMVKAVFLLNSFLSQIKADIDKGEEIKLDKYKLDFSTYPNNLLGRFDKVVHNGSKSKTVTFEYTVYSLILSKDVTVQLVFSADENDELNNAYLEKISFSTKEGVFYSCDKEGTYSHSFSGLKDAFLEFLSIEAELNNYGLAYTNQAIYGKNDSENSRKIVESLNNLKKIEKGRLNDVFDRIRLDNKTKKVKRPHISRELVESTIEKDSIFYIPVLDVLSQVPKKDFKSFVCDKFLSHWKDSGLYYISIIVANDFLSSEFDDFKSYYINYEKRFLQNVESKQSLGSPTLRLPETYDFEVFDTRLMFDKKEFGIDDSKTDEELNKMLELDFRSWNDIESVFSWVYSCVMAWNNEQIKEQSDAYDFSCDEVGIYYAKHHVFRAFVFLLKDVIMEAIRPDWSSIMSYVGSARANISRLYSLDGNDDFTKLLKTYFENKRTYILCQKECVGSLFELADRQKRDYVPDAFINRWAEKFGIGKSISFEIDREGLGVQIRLHKTDNDEGRLLADEGYGITQLVSVLLQIETAILSAKGIKSTRFMNIPVVLDCYDYFAFHYEPQTIAIEEPEIHLHPKYQSLLADMFLEAYEKYNIHFIIETHSEYLIRKTQVFVSQAKYKSKRAMNEKNPFKVYYVPEGGKPYDLGFKTTGRFENSFGEGFFDEAGRLALNLSKYDKTDDKIDIDWTNI